MKHLNLFEKFSRILESEESSNLGTVNNQKELLRYKTGADTPGIEDYFADPLNDDISDNIREQLENDPYGKGRIAINFNDFKKMTPAEFMQKIEEDAEKGICYKITEYEYNNRSFLGTGLDLGISKTIITIKAVSGPCKLKGKPRPTRRVLKNKRKPSPKPNPESKPIPIKDRDGRVIDKVKMPQKDNYPADKTRLGY